MRKDFNKKAQPVTIRISVKIPIKDGIEATLLTFNNLPDEKEHLGIIFDAQNPDENGSKLPLVRLHSECLTGDVFGSMRCDCQAQLNEAIDRISEEGGVILYLRQEGRGIGLYNKLDAYDLQINKGMDTYEANSHLGLPQDARDYKVAADMLLAMGYHNIRLLTGNPDKTEQLKENGIDVTECVPTEKHETAHNRKYLSSKQGHGHKFG